MGRRSEKAKDVELPPVKDPATESRKRRSNKVADVSGEEGAPAGDASATPRPPAEGQPAAGRRGAKAKAVTAAESAPPAEGAEPTSEGPPENGAETGAGAPEVGSVADKDVEEAAAAPSGDKEHWDLCLVVDASTKIEEDAEKEVASLESLLRKEGLTLSQRTLIDPDEGVLGPVMILCTASQPELEQEAEIMYLNKPLKLSEEIAERFSKTGAYGRVTAPFSVARRSAFHESPYLEGDTVQPYVEDESIPGEQLFFSPCERQNLMEHIIENKIREAVARHRLSPNTDVTFFPLHDADDEGKEDLAWLAKNWSIFFRKERWISCLKIFANPHMGLEEPLDQIRNYFGDQIAMYFGFLGFYTRWLTFPAIVGLAFQLWSWISPETGYKWGLVAYCVFIPIWAFLMIRFWERKEHALAYYWFTSDLSSEEKVRREFYLRLDAIDSSPIVGKDDDAPQEAVPAFVPLTESNVRVKNRKTGQIMYKYPKWRRVTIYCWSAGSITVLVCCVVIGFIYCYLINFVAEYWDCTYGAQAGAILHSALIIGMGALYKAVATKLNDLENHRTDIKYENSLIFKVFLFEICNNFLAMFWIAFLSSYFCDLDLTTRLWWATSRRCSLRSSRGRSRCSSRRRHPPKTIQSLRIKRRIKPRKRPRRKLNRPRRRRPRRRKKL
ncbi:calcium-activated chloride channel-domain-containing protein [Baffinella frigidus]|nr:calcium-activated chloride channel-domain-containing protein [Cryptophyta sp. CCMP2293]